MSITPLDLQMLFSQLDKIGKDFASQKESTELREAMLHSAAQKKTEIKMKTVREADDSGEGPEKLKDKKKGAEGGGERRREGGRHEEEDSLYARKLLPLKDPNLGHYVDISG